jgi:argininosuccinate lyase
MRTNVDRMQSAAADPNLLATDLAEYLVRKGAPFREAHRAVGQLVADAVAAHKQISELSLEELRGASPLVEPDVRDVFDVRKALTKRNATGAPSFANVDAQLARWRDLLAARR